MHLPKISVVIPTYNRAKYLDQTIGSVICQKNADFEIIISDNCSIDNTFEVVEKYLMNPRVKYFKNATNIGMVNNWKEAVFNRSSAEWFIILSDDDYFVNDDYLRSVLSCIEKNENIVLVYGEGTIFDETKKESTFLSLPFPDVVSGIDIFMSRGTVKPQDATLCNMAFNRRLAMELNAFSNPDNLSCDSELYLKCALLGNVGIVKGNNSVYRFHSSNLVNTISSSPSLRLGNLDFIFNVHDFAKDKLNASQIHKFLENVNAKNGVQSCLLKSAAIGLDQYILCKKYLLEKNHGLTKLFIEEPAFKIKLFLCRYFGRVLPFYLGLKMKFLRMKISNSIG
ncbi:glycosyltransferase family 2 protein [Janthinobacterium sp. 13]|uniref:glycosyltransferase family 2 protein n=1 Tax=Janthinobacterium sp. 13 TaxID=2035211 RepID=UPI000C169EF9|nr:glycosyltransferase [Janthinobacterium sp. 13]PIF11118.1 glycosyl transferase family 2 [Janthinobacterium sp. 13]